MAVVSITTINAAVRFRGDYQNVAKFPDADVNREIQAAFAEFWEFVADEFEGYWDTKGDVTIAAGAEFVALPSTAWRVQVIERMDGSDPIPMDAVSVQDRRRYGSSRGEPQAYRLSARGAEVYPVPDTTYTLRVHYTPYAPQLADTTQDFFNGWEDYVIWAALARLDSRERRPVADRLAQVEAIKKRIKTGATHRKQQEPEYLQLREGTPTDLWDRDLY